MTIEVEDTGKGIPAAEQDRVFERFYRGSGALEGEGFGLGPLDREADGGRDGRRDRAALRARQRLHLLGPPARPKPTPTPVA